MSTRHATAAVLHRARPVIVAAGLVLASMMAMPGTSAQTLPTAPPAVAQSANPTVDVELILAVDVSLSMDLEEQRLQRDGYVAAFRHAAVIRAITTGGLGRIAVTYIEWAGANIQHVVLPWRVIDSEAGALAFADDLASRPISRARMTSISSALEFAAAQFASSGERGLRRVIDVSGDGPNNAGRGVGAVRDELIARGIVINGLPIVLKPRSFSGFFDITSLDQYYQDCVIGGPGAFMIPVRAASEFPTAIRQKLLLEIAGLSETRPLPVVRTQATAPSPPGTGKSDCLIGEKLWQRYLLDRFNE